MEKYKKSLSKKWSRSLMGGGRLREVVAHGEVRLYSQTTTNGTVTSLQRPLYFVPAGRQSIHWLLFKPIYNGNGH